MANESSAASLYMADLVQEHLFIVSLASKSCTTKLKIEIEKSLTE